MILVHHHRQMRVSLDCRLDQMLQERLAGIFARPCTGLHDDRRTHRIGSSHDGLHLFQIVDIEGRNAVAVLGGMVEQLAH